MHYSAAKAGVMTDVPEDAVYVGIPALESKQQRQIVVAQTRLPEMRKELKKLIREVASLQQPPDAEGRRGAA